MTPTKQLLRSPRYMPLQTRLTFNRYRRRHHKPWRWTAQLRVTRHEARMLTLLCQLTQSPWR
jgi:hypothetical protein